MLYLKKTVSNCFLLQCSLRWVPPYHTAETVSGPEEMPALNPLFSLMVFTFCPLLVFFLHNSSLKKRKICANRSVPALILSVTLLNACNIFLVREMLTPNPFLAMLWSYSILSKSSTQFLWFWEYYTDDLWANFALLSPQLSVEGKGRQDLCFARGFFRVDTGNRMSQIFRSL